MINGVTRLLMTKADVLSGFETIKVCTSYYIDGKECHEIPFDTASVVEPIYTELPGWNEDITGIRSYDDLPAALKGFVTFVEKETSVPVMLVSVGPDREETIIR